MKISAFVFVQQNAGLRFSNYTQVNKDKTFKM